MRTAFGVIIFSLDVFVIQKEQIQRKVLSAREQLSGKHSETFTFSQYFCVS